jgi:hypothetical protein
MPPFGATLGEHNGNDGDDWKWRNVGLLRDGVEGMTSLVGLLSLIPGVAIVRLRFDGRLRGGVGGLMKRGDGGAELFFSASAGAGAAAGPWARRFVREVVVLMPRFFRLRAFLAGVVGRANSKKLCADKTPSEVSGLRALKSEAKEWFVILGKGDSGEGPGEGSVTDEESMVDMVVVGELSEEVVELESRESWWLWKDEKGAPCVVVPLVVRRATLLPCAVLESRSAVWACPMVCESAPKTAPREGMGMNFLEVVVGMLGSCRDEAARAVRVRVLRARALLGQRRWCARVGPGYADSKERLRADERLARTGRSAWCATILYGQRQRQRRRHWGREQHGYAPGGLQQRQGSGRAGQASVVGGRGRGRWSVCVAGRVREDAGSSKRLEGVTAARIAWWILGAGGRQQQRRSGRSCRGGSGGAGAGGGGGGGGGGARGGLHASGFRLKGSEANGRLGAQAQAQAQQRPGGRHGQEGEREVAE